MYARESGDYLFEGKWDSREKEMEKSSISVGLAHFPDIVGVCSIARPHSNESEKQTFLFFLVWRASMFTDAVLFRRTRSPRDLFPFARNRGEQHVKRIKNAGD